MCEKGTKITKQVLIIIDNCGDCPDSIISLEGNRWYCTRDGRIIVDTKKDIIDDMKPLIPTWCSIPTPEI